MAWAFEVGVAALWPGVGWIASSFISNPVVGLLLWLAAGAVFCASALALVARALIAHRWWCASVSSGIAAGLAASFFLVNWSMLGVHGFFDLHRGKFTQIAELASRGELACVGLPQGDQLPSAYRDLSVDAKAIVVGACDRPSGVVLPRMFRLLDGGAGYIWYSGRPTDGWDLNGDPLVACVALGDGWYWAQTNSCS